MKKGRESEGPRKTKEGRRDLIPHLFHKGEKKGESTNREKKEGRGGHLRRVI